MKKACFLLTILLLIFYVLLSGCINQDLGSLSDSGPEKPVSTSQAEAIAKPAESTGTSEHVQQPNSISDSSASVQLKGFIEKTFPQLTAAYVDIKKSGRALDAIGVQEKALAVETLVQDLTNEYHLDQSLPEKNVFPGLSSKEEVIFNKYLGYIRDLGQYAMYLKEAVYWKSMGSDPNAPGNYRRNQDLADQFGKKVVTDIQTLNEYAKEWGFLYLDDIYTREYSLTS